MADAKPFVLPSRVQVGPFWYRLRQDSATAADGCYGQTHHFPNREIVFSTTITDEERMVTFIHELFHAIEGGYGVTMKEELIKSVANGMAQALQSAGLLPERAVLEGEEP